MGYLGDGINDVSALHTADVGISVDTAVDVAKEAADIVLLDKSLLILIRGIKEGRRTFANTMKYIFMATSANFGNMFSMAAASVLLPFIPLLPTQVLLTNLLTDLPEMNIATDFVDDEQVQQPPRWNMSFIKRFMIVFGFVSSIFDFVTFYLLFKVYHASESLFHSAWFIESVLSASLTVLLIRTHKPFYKSKPSGWLASAIVLCVIMAAVLPFTPMGQLLGFISLPVDILMVVFLIVAGDLLLVELAKYFFFKTENKALKKIKLIKSESTTQV